jgi:acetate kinase
LHILVINSGSSSIKFSIFETGTAAGQEAISAPWQSWPRALFGGEISGIGSAKQAFRFSDANGRELGGPGKTAAADPMDLLEDAVCGPGVPPIDAVGYRVVHPGPHLKGHQKITDEVLKDLEQAVAFAPLHDPAAIALIRETMKRFPQARHYACFDTVFHQTMPAEASAYAIPVTYRDQGVRRYGFHGLSCEGVVDDLRAASERGQASFPHSLVRRAVDR